MPVDVRGATLDDATAMARLSGELGYPTSTEEARERLAAILSSAEHLVLVARSEGETVGWIHAFAALRVESGRFAEVGGLVVSGRHRGAGIGRRLLAAAEAWAAGEGMEHLRVRSRSTRRDAHRFYERLGFDRTKQQDVFDKHIQESSHET